MAAVAQDGRALEYVRKSLQTAEICMAAVQQDGRALEFAPQSLKTAEICMAAVAQDGYALKYVPESLYVCQSPGSHLIQSRRCRYLGKKEGGTEVIVKVQTCGQEAWRVLRELYVHACCRYVCVCVCVRV